MLRLRGRCPSRGLRVGDGQWLRVAVVLLGLGKLSHHPCHAICVSRLLRQISHLVGIVFQIKELRDVDLRVADQFVAVIEELKAI